MTFAVSIGAAGVAYIDSRGSSRTASRRGYTRTSGTVTLAPQAGLGTALGGPAYVSSTVSRDGRRTAYVDTDRKLWIVTDQGVRTKVIALPRRTATRRSAGRYCDVDIAPRSLCLIQEDLREPHFSCSRGCSSPRFGAALRSLPRCQ
jgi:hypothetical protein